MKLSNRSITLSATAIVSLGIGIAVGSTFSFPSANAVTPSANTPGAGTVATSFVQTGSLSLPGGGTATRIVDNEYGIVCYTSAKSGAALGCAKR